MRSFLTVLGCFCLYWFVPLRTKHKLVARINAETAKVKTATEQLKQRKSK